MTNRKKEKNFGREDLHKCCLSAFGKFRDVHPVGCSSAHMWNTGHHYTSPVPKCAP
jgi:hypothetical protein